MIFVFLIDIAFHFVINYLAYNKQEDIDNKSGFRK
jgi:hypothetical protein